MIPSLEINPQVVDWLLEEDNPSVMYRTLTELLDEKPGDPKVHAAKDWIASSKPVQYIFSKMHPDGYWEYNGKGAGVDYVDFVTTHFNLSFLAELGLDRKDPRVALAAERYLNLSKPDGDYAGYMSCLFAYNIRTFIMLGYGNDPHIRKSVELMLSTSRHDGGYLCDMHERKRRTRPVKSCINGSTKALMAYAMLPELWKHPRCKELVDYFLRRRVVYQTGEPGKPANRSSDLMIFPFHWRSNLLESAYALCVMGYGNYPELEDMWKVFESKKDRNARYALDWDPPRSYFKTGKRGRANKWVTLYAYLAIKHKDSKESNVV